MTELRRLSVDDIDEINHFSGIYSHLNRGTTTGAMTVSLRDTSSTSSATEIPLPWDFMKTAY